MRQLFGELKRRNVYQVAVTYAVVAFVVWQAASLLFPALGFPAWTVDFVIVLTLLGFPVALVLAWAFELTPEGVRRTPDAEGTEAEEAPAESRRSQSRLALKALVGLGLIGAAVAGGWYLMGGGGESPEVSERTVAVLPFQVSGSGADTWRDGMVTMLSTGLDGAAGLRAIADQTVLAAWEQAGQSGGAASRSRSLTTAREVGAEYAVVGQAVRLGDELRMAADIHDTRSGDRVGQVEVAGSPDHVTALTDSLTRRVLGVLLEKGEQDLPSVNLASLTTSSLPALKAYLAGERHFRAAEYEAAIEDYEAAVAEDSTFALAYARLAHSHGWLIEPRRKYWKQAYQYSDRLPERERGLVRAIYVKTMGDHPMAAADTLRRLAEAYPDDPSIWYELGETVFHYSIPGGWPEADTAFGRAVELDPGMEPYHHHYGDLAIGLHHDSALAAERIAAHPEGSWKERLQNSLELVFGSRERRQQILQGLDSIPLIPFALNHPADGELWIQVLQEEPTSFPTQRRWWRVAGAKVWHGQVQEALTLARSESWAPTDMACLLAHASSLAMPVPASLARQYLEPENVPEDATVERLLCSGLYLVDQSRGEALPDLIRRIRSVGDTLEGQQPSKPQIQSVVDELRGYQAYRAGELKKADRLWSSSNESQQWGAIWRGDLYRDLQELEKAEGWYFAAWRHPVAHERLGQLYQEMDKPEKSAAAYRRFIAAWKDADPGLQDRVEEARKRLQALTGSGTEADD